MKFVETCSCGAGFEVSGWFIREVEGLDEWRRIHLRCSRPKPIPPFWKPPAGKPENVPPPRDPGKRGY